MEGCAMKPMNINGALITERALNQILSIQEDHAEYATQCIKEINRYLIKSTGGELNHKDAGAIIKLLIYLSEMEDIFHDLATTSEQEEQQ
jgi:hypothetical protein